MISGIIAKKGNPARILEKLKEGKFKLVTSKRIIDEFIEVVHRPKIIKKYKISEDEIGKLVNYMYEFAEVLYRKYKVTKSKDIKDNCFLECAFEGDADYLVSGDSHLLKLRHFYNTDIVKPTDFLQVLTQK